MADISYRANLSGALSYAAAGLIAGALIVMTTGVLAWWLVVIVAAALLAVALGGAGRRTGSPLQTSLPPDLAWGLPSLAREVLEAVPDPLMLVDSSARVIFANSAMAGVVGTDLERKPIASLLRAPALLQAVERTQESGEASSAEFVERVPVERHYRALIARMEQPPQLTAILLHDLTALKRAEQARAISSPTPATSCAHPLQP